MAKLTSDQILVIQNNQQFIDLVGAVIGVKAQQWETMSTVNRSDVNRQMQKRKRLANQILGTSWAESRKRDVAAFWLTWYAWNVDPAVLDPSGLPSYDTIFNSFDATWDEFAGVITGDDVNTNIDW